MNLVPWIVEILTVTLLASTKITTVAITTSTREACANGLLTLHYKAIRDVNTVENVLWKIKFPGTGWVEFSECTYKFGVRCIAKRSRLAEGINLVNNSNGAVTIERSAAGNNTHDYAHILCVVHYVDGPVSHVYEINFTAHCVRIQKGRDLNLTSILLNLRLPCKHGVVDIDLLDVNKRKFAYCNTCQTCTQTNNSDYNHPLPLFWNRLRVTRGALMLTAIQDSDDRSEFRVHVQMTEKLAGRNVYTFHRYAVRIFVTSVRDSPEPNTTPKTDIGAPRSSLPFSKPSYPVVQTPSTTAKLHSGSPTRNGASAAASAAGRELWTAVVAVFLCISLR